MKEMERRKLALKGGDTELLPFTGHFWYYRSHTAQIEFFLVV
jgi:hypothetical protein